MCTKETCLHDVHEAIGEHDDDLLEAETREANIYGCYCLDDENCSTCTDFTEEEDGGEATIYPHVKDLVRDEPIKHNHILTEINNNSFRAFVSRAVSR